MPTCLGTALSILFFTLMTVFATSRMNIVIEQSNTATVTAVHDSFYTSDDAFGVDQGFAVAVAVNGGGKAFQTPDGSLDPSYAEIKAVGRQWSHIVDIYDNITTHPCTDEELGLDGLSNSQFMKVRAEDLDLLTYYKDRFKCIDKQKLNTYGSWSSSEALILSFELHRCTDQPHCKSDDEITEGLKGANSILLHN